MPRGAGTCVLVATSDSEPLDDRLHRDDVTLEVQLRLLEARGDADQLGQVQDRHREPPTRGGLELRLPAVERQVAQRSRSHDRIRARLGRLLYRLEKLAERNLLARLDDRDAAPLDLCGIVDGLPAACLDERLQRPGP